MRVKDGGTKCHSLGKLFQNVGLVLITANGIILKWLVWYPVVQLTVESLNPQLCGKKGNPLNGMCVTAVQLFVYTWHESGANRRQ